MRLTVIRPKHHEPGGLPPGPEVVLACPAKYVNEMRGGRKPAICQGR